MKIIKNQLGMGHHVLLVFLVVFGVVGFGMYRVVNAQMAPKQQKLTGTVTVCDQTVKSCKNKPLARVSGHATRVAKPGEITTQVVYPFTTDAKGAFSLKLFPAKYDIVITPGNTSTTCAKKTVTITKKGAKATVACKSGTKTGPKGTL